MLVAEGIYETILDKWANGYRVSREFIIPLFLLLLCLAFSITKVSWKPKYSSLVSLYYIIVMYISCHVLYHSFDFISIVPWSSFFSYINWELYCVSILPRRIVSRIWLFSIMVQRSARWYLQWAERLGTMMSSAHLQAPHNQNLHPLPWEQDPSSPRDTLPRTKYYVALHKERALQVPSLIRATTYLKTT